jgi:nicotinamidase-related amidase
VSDEYETVRTVVGRLETPDLARATTALVVIDLQVLDADPDGAHARRAHELGTWPQIEDYFARVGELVVPGVNRLATAVRERGGPVIFVRCCSLTPSARDNGRRFRDFGIEVGRDDPQAALLRELEVDREDIVLDKTTASPFWSTSLERVLGQFGVECLLVAGVVTSGCCESTVRDACDLDYQVLLVEDACADREPELHADALRRLHNNFALVADTDSVLRRLAAITPLEGSHRV